MKDDEQLPLFADVARRPKTDDIPPHDQALIELASRIPPRVRFGTSSWTFPGWTMVYRRRYGSQRAFVRDSLGEYARYPLFGTVGIDRSFYTPVPREDLADYAAQLPPRFPCLMKVFSEIATQVFPNHPSHGERAGTRNARFLDAQLFEDEIGAPVRDAFASHAFAQLLELTPGGLDVDDLLTRLDRFLSQTTGTRFAVEVRDWRILGPRYFATLRAHGAAHVFNFWSRMPPIREQLAMDGSLTAPFVVARLMLPPGESYEALREAYAPFDRIVTEEKAMRDDVVELVRRALEREADVFVIANNKAEGSSPLTVKALAERVASQLPIA